MPARLLAPRSRLRLAGVVVGAALINGLLSIPTGRPRVFGDELIYWQLSRGLAWTGHYTVRGLSEVVRLGALVEQRGKAGTRRGDIVRIGRDDYCS